ncbi:dUTP diphosphatase [uncultured Eubacterium sp.]|uniref:dUTP diphosphatase n=1 Tax=uncultured Eubacterium sp. TaxID=165185 RepID=UPI002671DFBA|nr:dUTP diphosphatase [uncultured Eubacterium sp.]
MTQLNFKKLKEYATTPTYGSDYAAGADLYACIKEPVTLLPGETKFIGTGIAMEIPIGYAGFIYARSGLSCKMGVAPANKVGVVDSDYRGEITVALYNHSPQTRTIEPQERIAQIVVAPFLKVNFNEVDELSDTVRGADGFGSTGRK